MGPKGLYSQQGEGRFTSILHSLLAGVRALESRHAGAGVGVGAGAGADAGAGAGAGSFFYCIALVISLSHFPGFVFV